MGRPGIMVYFDMMGPLSKLQDADKGRLFWAMLEYGNSGVMPVFDDLALEMAWEFVKPKLDKDCEEYNRTVLKRQYATFCRDRKKKGESEITFDEWLKVYANQMISSDITWYPTTATASTTSTTTTTATATTTTADALAKIKDDFFSGKMGQGAVVLSHEQVEDLLRRMGVDSFVFYVDKLGDFIIQNDAHVNSCYETIQKWWMQDAPLRNRRKTVPKGASGQLGEAELAAIRRALAEE